MPYSIFGNKFTQHSGITELMDDLNAGVQGGDDILMLGGGNPASIPEIQDRLTVLLQNLLDEGYHDENIFVTGNTVIDSLLMVKDKIETDVNCLVIDPKRCLVFA